MMPPRAWQRMLSGRRLDLLDPSPLDIEIEDIAHGLSRVARWNGQTKGRWAFSVAQHSLLVLDLVEQLRPKANKQLRLAALLHDSPEYVVGDLITPFKSSVGLNYKALEERLLSAIHLRFGLPARLPRESSRLIKRADRAAAFLEATQLAGFELTDAKRVFSAPRNIKSIEITPHPPQSAKKLFLERFRMLYRADKTA